VPRRLARRPLRVEPLHLTFAGRTLTSTDLPPYVETSGPEVAEICALAGFAPDPEQELALDLLFAIRPDGKSAIFEFDLIGPRQNLKTGLIKQAELGWLFVTEERLIVHSAHELSTTEESFNELAALIENTPTLSRHLAATRGDRPGISEGNGRWAIELRSGQRIKYKARTKGGGRGLTGDKVILDEGFALMPTHMGSLLPTLAAVPDPQVLTASSGGLPQSEVLRDKRDRGRAGLSPRQAYMEFGDPDPNGGGCAAGVECSHAKSATGCALDDEDRWARIMSALDVRVDRDTIRSMRQALSPEEFAREFMVWWDEPDDFIADGLDPQAWLDMEGATAGPLTPLAVGVTVSPDRQRAWIGVAGQREDDLLQVELVAEGRGTRWLVDWLAARIPQWNPCAVVLDGTALSIAKPLADLGFEVTTTSSTDRTQATVGLFDLFNAGKLRHPGEEQLDQSVQTAAKKPMANGFVWDGPNAGPLVAITLAAYGVATAEVPEPPPAPRRIGGSPRTTESSPRRPRREVDVATAGF
jgi:hypothetical protein